MKLDTGTIILLIAVGIFYLRLVLVTRAHASARQPVVSRSKRKKMSGKQKDSERLNQYWILSPYPRDWIIAGLGVLAMTFGILLNTGTIPLPNYSDYWWVPLSVGVLLFSFGFR